MRILVVSALASLPFLGSAMAKTTRGAFGDGVTWNKDNVQAIPGQNVSAGDFNALVAALESETAYANVHTIPHYAGGEIRGQVFPAQGQQGNQNQQ